MNLPPRDSLKTKPRLTGHIVPSRGITSATISSKAKITSRRSLSVTVPGPSNHHVPEIRPTSNAYSRSRTYVDELSRSARRASTALSGPIPKSIATIRESESRKVKKDDLTTWSALSQTLPTLDLTSSSSTSPSFSQLDSHAIELYLVQSTFQLRLAAQDVSTSVQELIDQAEEELKELEAAVGVDIHDEQVKGKRILWEALTKHDFAHRFIPLLHELSILNASSDAYLDALSDELEDDESTDERELLARSKNLQNSFRKIQINFGGLTTAPDLSEQSPQVLSNLLELYTLSIMDRIERLKSSDREVRRKRQEKRQIVWKASLGISQMK